MAKSSDTRPVEPGPQAGHPSGMPAPGGSAQQPTATEQAAKIAELEAKLAAQAERDDGRKTTRGLTPSIQALATIDTALRKLKGEDAAAVQRVVAWIAQEWLPANKVMTDKPGG